MSEGGGHLDLQTSHIANAKPDEVGERLEYLIMPYYSPKYSSNGHHKPEVDAGEILEAGNNRNLTKDDHEWQEKDTSIDIVVEGECPDVAVNNRENLLGVNGKEGNKQRSQDTIDGTSKRKASRSILLINTEIETTYNSSTAGNGTL